MLEWINNLTRFFSLWLGRFVYYNNRTRTQLNPLTLSFRFTKTKGKCLSLLLVITVILAACNATTTDRVTTPVSKTPQIPCKIVQHGMGETCIPNNPQRVITISRYTLANALVVGIRPIGSTTDYEMSAYLKDQIDGIAPIGGILNPNLEKILLLKPDLILGYDVSNNIYSSLSQISPTALGGSVGLWREYFNFVAEILGKEEAAQQAWDHYYQRIEELKIALGNRYKGKEISIIQLNDLRSFPKNSCSGSIFNDLGLERPAAQNINHPLGYASEPISLEKLEEVDGDFIFVMVYGKEDKKIVETLKQNPLWNNLKAVRENQIYFVDREPWVGCNLIAADVVIDDLYKYLINTPVGGSGE